MLMAVVEVRDPGLFRRFSSPLVAIAGLAAVAFQTLLHGGFPIALGPGVGAVLLIGWLESVKVPFPRPLAFAGGMSYALYLWHKDLMVSFGVVGVLIAIAGAAASWAFVERPMLERAHAVGARIRRPRPRLEPAELLPAELLPAEPQIPIEVPVPVSSN
jgi:peptidoglycan/LPS O-acetylase OafA/YrhL